ncbi:hypothetical protein H8356DRAFT_1325999 [Neocallimastix lanati (nom. inval.)]|nr:hypothetical protein H8356DRAFT_1325999 [Neocallimastix sp. JGI-2020a]
MQLREMQHFNNTPLGEMQSGEMQLSLKQHIDKREKRNLINRIKNVMEILVSNFLDIIQTGIRSMHNMLTWMWYKLPSFKQYNDDINDNINRKKKILSCIYIFIIITTKNSSQERTTFFWCSMREDHLNFHGTESDGKNTSIAQ